MSGKVFNEKCVVTGEPARYRDPVTGQPYATLAAFKILRERFVEQVRPPSVPPCPVRVAPRGRLRACEDGVLRAARSADPGAHCVAVRLSMHHEVCAGDADAIARAPLTTGWRRPHTGRASCKGSQSGGGAERGGRAPGARFVARYSHPLSMLAPAHGVRTADGGVSRAYAG